MCPESEVTDVSSGEMGHAGAFVGSHSIQEVDVGSENAGEANAEMRSKNATKTPVIRELRLTLAFPLFSTRNDNKYESFLRTHGPQKT